MTAIFSQGNAKTVLQGMPENFIHCCVTSPPYFGLRRYEGGQEVWDGDENCEHQWGNEIVRRDRGTARGANAVVGNQVREVSGTTTKQGNFCALCGAWKGQLGAEPTPDLYISHLVQIFREVRRVLRDDGVCWVNVGDSWAGSGGAHKPEHANPGMSKSASRDGQSEHSGDTYGLKPLDMVLIPSLLALALRADGWYLRSIVIWDKKNPMPESVNGWRWERHKVKIADAGHGKEDWRANATETPNQDHSPDGSFQSAAVWRDCPGCQKCAPHDGYILRKGSWRPTDSYEQILMLTKTDNYYCDREAVLEPIAQSTIDRGKVDFGGQKGREYKPDEADPNFRNGSEQWGRTYDYTQSNGNGGRNLRSVWSFPTKPGKFNHYAAYPPHLPEICIKASTSAKGCCPKCGSPYARVIAKGFTAHDGDTGTDYAVGSNANRLALLRQVARKRGQEYGSTKLNYDSKYKQGGGTGLATQGFQRTNSIENGRSQSRDDAALLFPNDIKKQQEYINDVHEHGGLEKSQTVGWLPTCSCRPSSPIPCRVLDPFSGAGTTALVAEQLGVDSFSIDTSAEYIELSKKRLADDEQKRLADFIKKAQSQSRKSGTLKGVRKQ